MISDHSHSNSPIEHAALPLGALDRASSYASFSDDAAKMRSATPVFVASIEAGQVDKLKGLALFRMGAIEINDCVVMTARLQKGSAQFIWLADATDPDFWAALDNLRRSGRVGFAFVNGGDTYFMPYKIEQPGTAIDRYRRQLGRKGVNFIAVASSMFKDRTVEQMTSSMIPGLPVECFRVNILSTRRVRAAAEALGGMVVPNGLGTSWNPGDLVSAPGTVQ